MCLTILVIDGTCFSGLMSLQVFVENLVTIVEGAKRERGRGRTMVCWDDGE